MVITIPLRVINLDDDGFHLLLEIEVYGQTSTVVLDTGASRTAFDKNLLQLHEGALINNSDKLSTGLGTNEMASFTAIIPILRISDLLIRDHEVAVLDLSTINIAYKQMNHPQVLGVLGSDILMKYKAVISYKEKQLKLNL